MYFVLEKFKILPSLTELLSIEVDTSLRNIATLWKDVKAKNLQHPSDPSVINCEVPLQRIFRGGKITFYFISKKLAQHLYPPHPIHIEHKIRFSGNNLVGPFPLQNEISAFLANIEKHKDIDACNNEVCGEIKNIHESHYRRSFYLRFSLSPLLFINALIASQSRGLKLVAGEASWNSQKEGTYDFYNQPWVEDAIIFYLTTSEKQGINLLSLLKSLILKSPSYKCSTNFGTSGYWWPPAYSTWNPTIVSFSC